jgi:glutathione S-transferase
MTRILYVGNRNYSSWSIRGSLLLRQSGIDCEEVVIPLDTDEGNAMLERVSPSRRVPVLHYDGLVIWDSMAIAEFLHERAPSAGLWPPEPDARAHARSISAEMHSGFSELRAKLPMDIRAKRKVPISAQARRDIERIEAIWTSCRQLYGAEGDYLFGSWCAADAMFAPVVSRFRTYGVTLGALAQAYADTVWEWPAFASLVAEAHEEPWSQDVGP